MEPYEDIFSKMFVFMDALDGYDQPITEADLLNGKAFYAEDIVLTERVQTDPDFIQEPGTIKRSVWICCRRSRCSHIA